MNRVSQKCQINALNASGKSEQAHAVRASVAFSSSSDRTLKLEHCHKCPRKWDGDIKGGFNSHMLQEHSKDHDQEVLLEACSSFIQQVSVKWLGDNQGQRGRAAPRNGTTRKVQSRWSTSDHWGRSCSDIMSCLAGRRIEAWQMPMCTSSVGFSWSHCM